MMTDREKLVELLDYIRYSQEFSCYDLYDMSDAAEDIADFLISKGVTVNGKRIECTFSIPIDGQEILRKAIEETEVDGKTLAEWIALLKDYKQQEWIPLDKQKPGEDEQVIVFFEGMRGTSAETQIVHGWAINGSASHWMPLPEPPKKEAP